MDEQMLENFRVNIKYYRMKKGLSGKYLSRAIGRSDSWVSQFESIRIKSPDPKSMLLLAKALGIKIADLVKPPFKLIKVSPEEAKNGLKTLEQIRKQMWLSGRAFSLYLGLSPSYWGHLIHGESHFSTAKWLAISARLNIPLNKLLERERR